MASSKSNCDSEKGHSLHVLLNTSKRAAQKHTLFQRTYDINCAFYTIASSDYIMMATIMRFLGRVANIPNCMRLLALTQTLDNIFILSVLLF